MWSLLRGEPDAVIRWAGPLLLGGLLLAFAAARLHTPGIICGVFAISLGASGATFMKWQTERGLWMLAAVFLLLFGAGYGLMVLGQFRDWMRGARQAEVSLMFDFSLGTMLLTALIRFLWQVARVNWLLPREPDDE